MFNKLSLSEIEKKLDPKIINVFKSVKDPELDIDIWTLELIYDVNMEADNINIKMTFTSPMCPFGSEIVSKLKENLKKLNLNPNIEIVFNPAWKPTKELREILGI